MQDVGPHPNRGIAIWLGISALFSSLAYIAHGIETESFDLKSLALQMFFLSSALAAWVIARSRVSVTTQGILQFDKQIKWADIESYEWVRGGTIDELSVRPRKPSLLRRTIKMQVSAEQRPVLEEWLAREVGPPAPAKVLV